MAAAGGAASIITQVQQGGPALVNNTLAGTKITRILISAISIRLADSEHRCGRRRAYHVGPEVH